MYSFGDLSKEISEMAKNLQADVNADKSRLVLTLVKEIIYRTPVDTSTALSNWQVGINESNGTFLPPYVAGKAGSSYNQSASAAYQVAFSTLKQYKGGVICVFNNTPYISALEHGSSTQAPSGFTKISIQSALNTAPRKF